MFAYSARDFLVVGLGILHVSPRLSVEHSWKAFMSNFKVDPHRCKQIYMLICNVECLPSSFEAKHLLWTLYFLHTYEKERRICYILGTDRKTYCKYIWPCVTAISSILPMIVSIKEEVYFIYYMY